jgi:hypothetical protein
VRYPQGGPERHKISDWKAGIRTQYFVCHYRTQRVSDDDSGIVSDCLDKTLLNGHSDIGLREVGRHLFEPPH